MGFRALRVKGLGFRSLGFRALRVKGLGFRSLGFRALRVKGLGNPLNLRQALPYTA